MNEANEIVCVLATSHLCSLTSVRRLKDRLLMTDLWFVVSANLLLSVLVV